MKMRLNDLGPSEIRTYSKAVIDLINPLSAQICIRDIAVGLSSIRRWNGQIRNPLTVAEHSIFVAEQLPDKFKIFGLMHDSAEAYLGDVSSKLKAFLPDYKKIEKNMTKVIFEKYGLVVEVPADIEAMVKVVDTKSLELEWGGHIKSRYMNISPSGLADIFVGLFNTYQALAGNDKLKYDFRMTVEYDKSEMISDGWCPYCGREIVFDEKNDGDDTYKCECKETLICYLKMS